MVKDGDTLSGTMIALRAGIRAWVVEFLVLKIIRTIAAGRADSRESKWYPVIPPNLRTPFRTKVLEVRGLYKMTL